MDIYENGFRALFAAALFTATAGTPSLAEDGDAARGRAFFGIQCTLCHTDDGEKGLGPNLIGIFGRQVGSTTFKFSPGMKASRWKWDDYYLDRFLQNSAAMVPDTTMPFSVPDRSQRADIIAYLKTLTRAEAPAGSAFNDWRKDRPGLRQPQ
ncbi:MAG: c-type cytochrome [Rhodomicrobium sp.]